MQPTPGDPELLNHYSVLVYPFRHHVVGNQRNRRLASLEPRWAPWASRFSENDLAVALEATAFFLPYIRGLLYPDILRLQQETSAENHEHWAQLLSAWSAAGTGAYGRDLPESGVVRLTLRPGLMGVLREVTVGLQPWAGGYTTEAVDLPASCQWIDALLFPSGLGFLLLHFRLNEEQPPLSRLIRLNQSLRHVHPPTRLAHMPVLRLLGGEELTIRDLMNVLTQGLAGPWTIPEEDRGFFSVPPAGERLYTDSEAGRSYGERCHLLSYACIDLEGVTPAELPAGPFPSAADRILFEYATCIGLGESVSNPVWAPSPEQATRLRQENRLALWRCWTGMVLKESVVFLAAEDLGFTRRSLPRHIENDYLPLYLFALFQKLQLYTFSTDLMHEVAHSCGQLRGARALLQRFIAFRSQYWFSEVTRKPQGGEVYRTFQRGLEVHCSYDLATSSIKDVKDYYESLWARQVQWFKDAITFGGPVTMMVGAVHMVIGDGRHTWTVAVVLAVGVLLFVLLRMCWRSGWPLRHRRSRLLARRVNSLPRLLRSREEAPSVPV